MAKGEPLGDDGFDFIGVKMDVLITVISFVGVFLLGSMSTLFVTRYIIKEELLKAREGGGLCPSPLPVEVESVTPEIVAIIGAVVAAHLGKRVQIKRVRRIFERGSNPWAQQGRVTIQASHYFPHSPGGVVRRS